MTHFRYGIDHPPATLADPSGWLQLFVEQRFFLVFSLLFGIGVALFLDSSTGSTPHSRVLLRRLLVLLSSSWPRRWATAAGAAVLIPASLVLTGGGLTLIPGVFLLGSALVGYGLVTKARVFTRAVGRLFIA